MHVKILVALATFPHNSETTKDIGNKNKIERTSIQSVEMQASVTSS
jgi:hypothetical protein